MKNLRGYKKKSYFNLAVIAMYSTLSTLSKIEINMMYHKRAYEDSIKCLDPPFFLLSHNTTY